MSTRSFCRCSLTSGAAWLSKLLRTIEIVAKRLNPGLRLSGVVLCMYESSTRLAAEVTRDVEDFLLAQSAGPQCVGVRAFLNRRFAATFAWPKHRASDSRSSITRRHPMALKTIASWLKNFFAIAAGVTFERRVLDSDRAAVGSLVELLCAPRVHEQLRDRADASQPRRLLKISLHVKYFPKDGSLEDEQH